MADYMGSLKNILKTRRPGGQRINNKKKTYSIFPKQVNYLDNILAIIVKTGTAPLDLSGPVEPDLQDKLVL